MKILKKYVHVITDLSYHVDQLHGLTSLSITDVLLFSRFSGVVFRCSWFSPVIWEFFILFVFTFVTVIFLSLLCHMVHC